MGRGRGQAGANGDRQPDASWRGRSAQMEDGRGGEAGIAADKSGHARRRGRNLANSNERATNMSDCNPTHQGLAQNDKRQSTHNSALSVNTICHRRLEKDITHIFRPNISRCTGSVRGPQKVGRKRCMHALAAEIPAAFAAWAVVVSLRACSSGVHVFPALFRFLEITPPPPGNYSAARLTFTNGLKLV